ncbi:flagellar biosynthetic protein FliO [Cellulomonas sp. C5510]|uniref:flagellar biosynthetic protein FliO n=1 Tax=Cellulomonas sp. C5510 TaxID=2871170 RepID=UPI001C95ED90|nr:flagellar biosynthetic protein FliO [Cellulomonas sp. C5510]QZN86151.1 flagellar biosynthetic protein FliO [Cellulomonas sp. C5510]
MDSVVLGLRVLLALACVIGLIWVLARRAGWGARRRPAGPAVEVVGRQALGRHAGVAVVAVGNRRLLLGYGEQNVTMLTELAPAPAEAPASPAAGTAQPAADRAPVTLGSLAAAVLPTPRRARAARPAAAAAAPEVPAASASAAGPRVPSAPPATGSAAQRERVFAQALATASSAPAPAAPTTPGPGAAGPARDAAAASAASAAAALAAAAAIPVEPVGSEPVPGLAGLEVAEVDAARLELAAHPAEATGALHGSVLAPSTWKQAVAALRERTVRR